MSKDVREALFPESSQFTASGPGNRINDRASQGWLARMFDGENPIQFSGDLPNGDVLPEFERPLDKD